jgi:DNA-binding beta-propeller fold protein YncE
VSVPRGLAVVSDYNTTYELLMYSLIDGTRIRRVGSKGNGKGQFHFGYGGLCVSPDGDSVLVADARNNRVQEVRIVDGSWVRFVGEGVLKEPQYVDCNADVTAVSEARDHRISVLSWADGSLRARFGNHGSGSGHLSWPCGVRLLANGSGVVVAEYGNHRLCVFTQGGEFVAAVGNRKQGLHYPFDVLICATDDSFIATSWGPSLVKMGWDGVNVGVYDRHGNGDGTLIYPTALAALPNDGCLVVDAGNPRVQQLVSRHAKLAWMRACVSCIVQMV